MRGSITPWMWEHLILLTSRPGLHVEGSVVTDGLYKYGSIRSMDIYTLVRRGYLICRRDPDGMVWYEISQLAYAVVTAEASVVVTERYQRMNPRVVENV